MRFYHNTVIHSTGSLRYVVFVFPLETGFQDLDPVVRYSHVKAFVDTSHTSLLPFLEGLEPWDMPSEQSR
jgi:hypothetical protein